MTSPTLLLERLNQIGQSLADSGQALALLGLGSCGLERSRLDAYSDLDFFAIVEPGQKARFIDRLDWLERIRPIAYRLRNSADGYKLMFDDGIFCEFAVFEPSELSQIPFAAGEVVWHRADLDPACLTPRIAQAAAVSTDEEWLVGEALTCLYVGLSRFRRGEKLSAHRFIHQYAFERILELCQLKQPATAQDDPFVYERRLEQRAPELAARLADMQQGLAHCPASAWSQLQFLIDQHLVNPALRKRIEALCQSA